MTTTQVIDRATGLAVFGREEFRTERFIYKPGQHAAFLGPTRKGKSQLAFNLLEEVATPENPAYVAVVKPRDDLVKSEGQRLGFRLTREWPPPPRMRDIFNGKPPGYLVWPKMGNMDTDSANAALIIGTLLRERYAAGAKGKGGIIVCDDSMVIAKVLGLDSEMVTHLAMSGAMGLGGWYFFQKPTDSGRASIWSYGASEHLFVFHDPDRRNRQRYGEIGGVDPKFVEYASNSLQHHPYRALYIKRTGARMCIVDSQ